MLNPPSVFVSLAPWLSDRFDAPKEAIEKLDTDDDWTFLIKIHALIESALNALILTQVDIRLGPFVKQLETGCVENGKLAWIKALDLLPKHCLAFVRVISPLRNRAAHDIRHSGFSFTKWIEGMDSTQRKNYLAAVRDEISEKTTFQGKKMLREDMAFNHPRVTVFLCSIAIMARVDIALQKAGSAHGQSTPKE